MKKDAYQMITDKMIESLKEGEIPWVKPWVGCDLPYNVTTGKTYSLLNCINLQDSGAYATYKQWQGFGGQVRKGAKSKMICFWSMTHKKVKNDKGMEEDVTIPFLRHYNVFHVSDVEFENGVPKRVQKQLDKHSTNVNFEHDKNEVAENILSSYAARTNLNVIETESDSAYFSPAEDKVVVPELKQFKGIDEYYSTKIHEFVHSTGAKSRLNRDMGGGFGSKQYAREELVAEMGASFLLNILGMTSQSAQNNNVAYVQSWIEVLEKDPRAIVVAAGKAQKAVEYILDNKDVKFFDKGGENGTA